MTNLERKENFIKKAIEKFGDKFDYSKVDSFRNGEKDKVCIICPIHGDIFITPKQFLRSKYGCQQCGYSNRNPKKNINEVVYKIDNIDLVGLPDPKILDETQIIGTIYCFHNITNNKLYIGKTVKSDYNQRFNEHKNKSKRVVNYFYNAIKKYGWNNFNKIILFQTEVLNNTKENKKYLDDIILEKEIYYINKYKTNRTEFGYNLTSGGDGIVGYVFSEESKQNMSEGRKGKKHWHYGRFNIGKCLQILQLDLNGNIIAEWPSTKEVERQLGYKSSNISRCCNNLIFSYKDFIWVKKEEYSSDFIENKKKLFQLKSKEVLQYDFLGNYINSFSSAAEASKFMHTSTIGRAACGANPQAANYIWIYKNDFSEELLLEKLEKVKECPSYYKTITKI